MTVLRSLGLLLLAALAEIGAALCPAGVGVIMYAPRAGGL